MPVTDLAVAQPVPAGNEAGRRLVLTGSMGVAGDSYTLTIPPQALQDAFLNQPAQPYTLSFTWPQSGDAVLADLAAPTVQRLTLRQGALEVELSAEPNLATATAAIQLDGAPLAWTLAADHYTLVSTTPVPAGAHTLTVATTLTDLGGRPLAAAFSQSFTAASQDTRTVFAAPDPHASSASAVGNLFGYQGMPRDPETGLVYFRNRYYDPELGRFITADPKGYVDGPSMYAFEMDDPANGSDPMGLADGGTDLRDVLGALWIMVGGSDATDDLKESGQSFASGIKKIDKATSRKNPPVSPEDAQDDAQFYSSAAANYQGLVAPLGPITRDFGEGVRQGAKGLAKSAVVASNLQLAGGIFGLAKKLGMERLEGESVLMFEQRVKKAAAEAGDRFAEGAGTGGAAGTPGTVPNRIYSARELIRRAEEPGPYHNFPESFNEWIFKGNRTVVNDKYVVYTQRGSITAPAREEVVQLSGGSVVIRHQAKVVEGTFEIGVRPSASGRTEVITHRFFRPDPNQ